MFVSAYQAHVNILEGIKAANPQGYIKMMTNIYDLALYVFNSIT
jgi:hypothetical protein